jgi:hypothetical protein
VPDYLNTDAKMWGWCLAVIGAGVVMFVIGLILDPLSRLHHLLLRN